MTHSFGTTGIKVPVPDSKREGLQLPHNWPKNRHLWVVTAIWHITQPGANDVSLDTENLMSLAGPGCIKCGIPYHQWQGSMAPCHGKMP